MVIVSKLGNYNLMLGICYSAWLEGRHDIVFLNLVSQHKLWNISNIFIVYSLLLLKFFKTKQYCCLKLASGLHRTDIMGAFKSSSIFSENNLYLSQTLGDPSNSRGPMLFMPLMFSIVCRSLRSLFLLSLILIEIGPKLAKKWHILQPSTLSMISNTPLRWQK